MSDDTATRQHYRLASGQDVTGMRKGGSAHPGFKAAEAKIGARSGIRDPGAVLAAASRKASPAAKKANPRLSRVK